MSHRRSRETRRRLKKLSVSSPLYTPSGAWYDEDKGRYIRYYSHRGSGYPK